MYILAYRYKLQYNCTKTLTTILGRMFSNIVQYLYVHYFFVAFSQVLNLFDPVVKMNALAVATVQWRQREKSFGMFENSNNLAC